MRPSAFRRAIDVLGTRNGFIAMMLVWMPAALYADATGPRGAQTAVAIVTWTILALTWIAVPSDERLQLIVVVLVATCLEISFSIIWGLYVYRFENLPLYVPPGHGLVYLLAVRLAATRPALHPRAPVVVLAIAAAWTLGAQLVPDVRDDVGLVLLPILAWFLLRGSRPAIYVGAFVATTMLELLGTGFGNWTWQAHVPGLPMGQGNPPSAIAAGYAILDAVTLAICAVVGPRLLAPRRAIRPVEQVGD